MRCWSSLIPSVNIICVMIFIYPVMVLTGILTNTFMATFVTNLNIYTWLRQTWFICDYSFGHIQELNLIQNFLILPKAGYLKFRVYSFLFLSVFVCYIEGHIWDHRIVLNIIFYLLMLLEKQVHKGIFMKLC